MAIRRGPEVGYDFSGKRNYRRKIWATFRDNLKLIGVPVAEAPAMLMPSIEGDEIEVALAAGFKENNLHVVDKNPAIVATLKRRYPKIHTYGVSVADAFLRMARNKVVLRVANIDLCAQVSREYQVQIGQVAIHGTMNGVFSERTLVALTCLRGRETPEMTERLKEFGVICAGHKNRGWLQSFESLSDRDRGRLLFQYLWLSLGWNEEILKLADGKAPFVGAVRAEAYVSPNGQSMLWCVWRLVSYEWATYINGRKLRSL